MKKMTTRKWLEREPTPSMELAALEACDREKNGPNDTDAYAMFRVVFRAMFDAAPDDQPAAPAPDLTLAAVASTVETSGQQAGPLTDYARHYDIHGRQAVTLTDVDRTRLDLATDEIERWAKALYVAGLHAGMERAAVLCEQKWRDGYRGEADGGFAPAIRAAVKHAW